MRLLNQEGATAVEYMVMSLLVVAVVGVVFQLTGTKENPGILSLFFKHAADKIANFGG